jgi:hypothetical protein
MSEDDRRTVRDAFERAGGKEPSIDGLLDAAPALQAEARARRAAVSPYRGSRVVPKLALATAALAILALLSIYSDRTASRSTARGFDALILSGVRTGENDALLDAVLSTERNDG